MGEVNETSILKKSLVWFTTDLRVRDNDAIHQAAENSDEVHFVYCFDPAILQVSPFGFRKIGVHRLWFLLESLKDLDRQLRLLGSGLYFLQGAPEEVLPNFAMKHQITHVYCQTPIAPDEIKFTQKVEFNLQELNVSLFQTSTSSLYSKEDLPFSLQEAPDQFTQFRKLIENQVAISNPIPTPTYIPRLNVPEIHLPTLEEFGFASRLNHHNSAFPFTGGETHAWDRIEDYFFHRKLLLKYKETRNGLIGESYSSKLSPWLSIGNISAKSIYWEIKKVEQLYGANESTYWLYFELMWRDFFQFMMLKHQEKYFHPGGILAKQNPRAIDLDKINSWIQGKTGDDFVDANMKELAATGFMSNRGRQNVASYFCKVLNQDWRIGAAYFEQQLLDYDPCSNYGNWAYLAGVGNDSRQDRVFNTQKQANTYDSRGEYRRLWLT